MLDEHKDLTVKRTYKTPSNQRIRRIPPSYSKDRFNAEALGGRLWHNECQLASKTDLSDTIPLEFDSMGDYIATFDPLVLEETREGIKADWAEKCSAGHMWAVDILSLRENDDGWATITLKINENVSSAREHMEQNLVAVLSLGRPPLQNAIDWAAKLVANPKTGNTSSTQNLNTRHARLRDEHTSLQPSKRHKGTTTAITAASAKENIRFPRIEEDGTINLVDDDDDDNNNNNDNSNNDDNNNTKDDDNDDPTHTTSNTTIKTKHEGDKAQTCINPSSRIVAGLLEGLRQHRHQSSRPNNSTVLLRIHPMCTFHTKQQANKDKATSIAHTHKDNNQQQQLTIGREDTTHQCPCCQQILATLKEYSRGWTLSLASLLISSEREFNALHKMREIDHQLRTYILKPQLLKSVGELYSDEVRRTMWPVELSKEKFIQNLKREYDHAQLTAIEMAACHLSSISPTQSTTTIPAPSPLPQNQPLPKLPFVLIQGPPGTGKTHTVCGVLNVWHLAAYQRYHKELENTIAKGGLSALLLSFKDPGVSRTTRVFKVQKPRILVCTPSNAACDELMYRVIKNGFSDGRGKTYKPNVIRVSSNEHVVSTNVRPLLLQKFVKQYTNMTQNEWKQITKEKADEIAQEIQKAILQESHCKGSKDLDFETARSLITNVEKVLKLHSELECLYAARPIIFGSVDRERREGADKVEENLLADAEMVFTTLSSTHRKVFQSVTSGNAPFQTVLIDEAGQSSEVSALQPLIYGAKQVVLVGDPQQLPATILSEAAKAVEMERSLFERLQKQGCPVTLLKVQYRMHPEIRQFPSSHFYNNQLIDADAIKRLPPEIYHSHRYMKPYLLFDVVKGKQSRGTVHSGSLRNQEEAEMAAGLYHLVHSFLEEYKRKQEKKGLPLPQDPLVAVITPYREQKNLLKDIFVSINGKESLSKVAIETIDSCQGRQFDIVIMSCVRAGGLGGGGLGFVNDVRRMNVAITRARRSLWILGAVKTLQSNKEWALLIENAKERGCVVENADAKVLFPDIEYWKNQSVARQSVSRQHQRKERETIERRQLPSSRQPSADVDTNYNDNSKKNAVATSKNAYPAMPDRR